ncbi:MAG: hypothetical protein C0467_21415 [Planctomycetaceae bacterium]|nr:hypothetical protein [Planctomycetaceae bacterium]
MNPPFWPRLGGTFAIGLAVLAAHNAVSAEPPTPVVQAEYPEPPAPEPEIERYHGTKKVGPISPQAPALRPPVVIMVPPPEPVVQVEARTVAVPVVPDTRVSDAVVDTLHTVRDDTRRVSTAAAVLLGQVGGWLKAPAPEARAVFPITFSYPAPAPIPQPAYYPPVPPWLMPAPAMLPAMPSTPITQASASVQQPAGQQPTIIVIREPNPAPIAPPAAAPVVYAPAPLPPSVVEPARGVASAPESYIGIVFGIFGLGIGLASWLRSGRQKRATQSPHTTAATTFPSASPAASPLDGVILEGGLYAGPRPDLAEPFDLGPSYEQEQVEKKRLESENQNAVLEFILSQNLALKAAFAGPTAEVAPAGPMPAAD